MSLKVDGFLKCGLTHNIKVRDTYKQINEDIAYKRLASRPTFLRI